MATVQTYTVSREQMWSTLIPYLENNWTWKGGVTKTGNGSIGSTAYFYLDEDKTIGLYYLQGQTGMSASNISIRFNGTDYHSVELASNSTFEIEITNTALILSFISGSNSISASNCHKIIVHNAINPKTNTTEQVISYVGNLSSGNVSAMCASDVITPVDMTEQNGGANVSSAQSVFVQLCNKASDFIATDVCKCLCTSLSGWSFGDAMIDGHRYRMSGSIYALDE
jgi:hypothetical protein